MPKRILIYRMGGLGDSLLTYPILEIFARRGFEVTVWGNPEYFEFAKIAGFCHRVSFYEPQATFDLCVFFSDNRDLFQRPNSVFVSPIPKERVWIVEHYIKSLKLNQSSFSQRLNLGFSQRREKNLCLLHPSSGSKRKNPKPEFFRILEKRLKNLGLKVVYLVGPAERELVGVFREVIYSEYLVDLAEIILSASIYIGLDSGVSHLSSYLGTPTIVIYGPTDPVIWRPIGECVSVVRYEKCPPCFPNVCDERDCLTSQEIINIVEVEVKRFMFP